jgi:DNA processing protein
MMHHPETLKYWLALRSVDHVGSVGFRILLEAFGSPARVFSAPLKALHALPGVGAKAAKQIREFREWDRVDAELEKARSLGVTILPFTDASYPWRLLEIHDFPPLLYVRGTLMADEACLAVVGSRAAGTYGRYTAERLSRELALRGVTVVSGLARGIDTAAHRGALAGRGRTIAVLGCGLDVAYPPENAALLEEILRRGAAITEYPFGTPPNANHFPARNRIISGLSLGVTVVEATEKSGSLITARLALEQGRDVFAVPGSVDAAGSRGTNRLIKEGAKLVESADDILEEILPQLERRPRACDPPEAITPDRTPQGRHGFTPPASPEDAGTPPGNRDETAPCPAEGPGPFEKRKTPSGERQALLDDREESILRLLAEGPLPADAIIRASGISAGEVLGILLGLELKGAVRQMPGNKFMRKE